MTGEMARYEYALVRYVHDLASEEFANVGLVLYAADQGKFHVRMSERIGRMSEFFGDVRPVSLRSQLRQFQRAVLTLDDELLHASLLEVRPESLEPVISGLIGSPVYSCFRASPIRFGITDDAAARVDMLYEEFIGRYERLETRPRRDEGLMSRDIDRRLVGSKLVDRLQFAYSLASDTYSHEFHAGWRNGKPQVLEPISFDYSTPARIVDKANLWSGRLLDLSRENDFGFTGVVAPPAEKSYLGVYERALNVLSKAPSVRDLIEEKDADKAIAAIALDLAS